MLRIQSIRRNPSTTFCYGCELSIWYISKKFVTFTDGYKDKDKEHQKRRNRIVRFGLPDFILYFVYFYFFLQFYPNPKVETSENTPTSPEIEQIMITLVLQMESENLH